MAASPPVALADDDYGNETDSEHYPHRQQQREQQDADRVFEGGQHVHFAFLAATRRRRSSRRAGGPRPVATAEREAPGERDATRGPTGPIVQPTVLRPHSSQRNERRPASRLKRSSCPRIRQRSRIGPQPTATWQSAEPAVATARSAALAPPAQAPCDLESVAAGASRCHVSVAATHPPNHNRGHRKVAATACAAAATTRARRRGSQPTGCG